MMRCFQKNPNLRTSAKKLRKHNWITNFVSRGSQKTKDASRMGFLGFSDAVTSVQEYNQKVNGPDLINKTPKRPKQHEAVGVKKTTKPVMREMLSVQIEKHSEIDEDDWAKDLEFNFSDNLQRPPLRLRSTMPVASLATARQPVNVDPHIVRPTGPRSSSQMGVRGQMPKLTTRQSMPCVAVSHRQESRRPGPASPISRRSSPEKKITVDDRTVRPSSAQLARNVPSSAPSTPVADRIADVATFKMPNLTNRLSSMDLTPRRLQRTRSGISLKSNGNSNQKANLTLQQFADEGEDYSDIVGDLPQTPALSSRSDSARYSEKSWMQDDDVGDDPFAEIEEFEKENLTANVLREQKARAVHQMERLIKDFHVHFKSEFELIKCSTQMLKLLGHHPDLQATFISSHALLPLLETLESSTEDDLVLVILELINALAATDDEVLENMYVKILLIHQSCSSN